jgi:type II secretory pathway pseudopilin PulG
MKNRIGNSAHVLVVVAVAALTSTAFVASLPTIPSAAQEIKAAERRTMTIIRQLQPNTTTT